MLRYAFRCGGATLALAWLCGLVSVGLELVTPAQVGALTDLFQQADGRQIGWGAVNWAVCYLLGAQLLIAVFAFVRSEREVVFEQSLVRDVVRDLFARLMRFSPDFFRDRDVESINTRMLEDTRYLAVLWREAMVAVPLAAISLVVFGAYMLWHNWFLGLCLIPLSLLSGYFLIFDRIIQGLNRRARETWEEVRGRCREVVAGADEIRNHAAFDFGLGLIDSSFSGFTSLSGKIGRWSAFFQATGPFIGAVQSGALYWLGAGLCMSGSFLVNIGTPMTWGDVIRFLLVAGLFRDPVRQIASFTLMWRMTRENARRVDEYFKRPIEFTDGPGAPAVNLELADVRFDNVSLVGQAGHRILDALSARIPAGRHVALVGYAGCGKSTALRTIVRGARPSAGRTLLSDRAVTEYDIRVLAENLGFVPQTPQLFRGSIRDNLLLALRRPGLRVLGDHLGPIDVTPLGEGFAEADLDQKLLETVRRVSFDEDVLQKALDGLLPGDGKFDELRHGLPILRRAAKADLQRQGADLLVPFDATEFLVPGTLQENLLGPGIRGAETAGGVAQWLFDTLQAWPCYDGLLKVGLMRVLSDHALASQVVGRAPRMAEWFDSWKRSGLDARELAECRFGEAVAGPRRHQRALFDVALETDAEAVPAALRDELVLLVLDARRQIGRMPALPVNIQNRWPQAGSDQYCSDLSLRENILGGRVKTRVYRGREKADGAVRAALADAGLLDLALLAGLEYGVGEGGKFLSGGQRQKVSLGRVLLKSPRILLLDEATASLDEISQARIVKMLARDFRGRTVVSISHRISTVKHFDKILVLDRGRVVQEGQPGELAGQAGPFRDLLAQQEGVAPGESETKMPAAPADLPDREAVRSALRRSPLLGELNGAQLQVLERVARLVDCPAGTDLFRRGDSGDELFLVCEGEVEFVAPRRDGGDAALETVDTFGPGGTFGELAMFGDSVRTLGARAKTDLQLASFDRQTMLDVLSADPSVATAFLRVLSRRLASARDELYGAAHNA